MSAARPKGPRISRALARAGLVVGGVLLFAPLLLGGPPVPGGGPGPRAGCAPATLSATPTSGSAPLLVNFSAQVPSSSVPAYAWTFGDGTYYNGSGPPYASPVHRYSTPGTYSVVVVVNSSAGQSVCSASISVNRAPLVAVAGAVPAQGSVPLNVTFTAQISGGTGTYLSAVWWFDDGDNGSGLQVTYTFLKGGEYRVLLNVTDSSGSVAHAEVWVNVTGGPGSGGPPPPGSPTVWGVSSGILGAAVGGVLLVGVVTVLGVRRWGAARRVSLSASSALPAGASLERPTLMAAAAAASSAAAAPGGALGRPGEPGPVVTVAAREEIPAETLRLSQRVIVHLAMQGALPDDAVATEAYTQGGMAVALGVPQNRLSNVLRRLRNAGAIKEDVRHVSGRARRMKVYRLTLLGERLAQDLRRRARAASGRTSGKA